MSKKSSSKDLDTVVVDVTNYDSALKVDRDTLRMAEMTGADTRRSKAGEEQSLIIKHQHPVVPPIRHKNVAKMIDNEIRSIVELIVI